jgi:UPF0042 nucleotide-binding protein
MNPARLVLVAGVSGAGQSQAMKSFEDLGYYCIEHLPPVMLADAIDVLQSSGITSIAIAPDVRTGAQMGDSVAAIDATIRTRGARLLFLDAHDDLLVRRFSQTRRRHPLGFGSVRQAIDADRRILAPLRERASVILDTSALTHAALKARIAAAFLADHSAALNVTIVAFGFKYGLPVELDLLFDVRFLRNPNYDETLAPLTGNDPAVGAYIADDPALEPFLAKLTDMLDFLIPRYLTEGKTRLALGIGCTGGRHRSVYVANRLLAHFSGNEHVHACVDARDLAPRGA